MQEIYANKLAHNSVDLHKMHKLCNAQNIHRVNERIKWIAKQKNGSNLNKHWNNRLMKDIKFSYNTVRFEYAN